MLATNLIDTYQPIKANVLTNHLSEPKRYEKYKTSFKLLLLYFVYSEFRVNFSFTISRDVRQYFLSHLFSKHKVMRTFSYGRMWCVMIYALSFPSISVRYFFPSCFAILSIFFRFYINFSSSPLMTKFHLLEWTNSFSWTQTSYSRPLVYCNCHGLICLL